MQVFFSNYCPEIFTYLISVLRAFQQPQFSGFKHSFQDHTQADLLKGTPKKDGLDL